MKTILLAVIVAISAFTACNDTSSPMTNPMEPTNIMATSINESTVKLKWTASVSEKDTNFKGYILEISSASGGPMTPMNILKSQNPISITNLTEGVVYTFSLKSVTNDGMKSDMAASVNWAPARRFTTPSIRVYEFQSTRGSGLELLNATDNAPKCLTVIDGDRWDLALDTRNDSNEVGSPKASGYTDANYKFNNGKLAKDFTIYKVIDNVTSLDDIYDSQAIDKYADSAQKMVNFTTKTKGFVMLAKTQEGNFAKIFVKDNSGVILQGTAKDRFIECEISYQKTKWVPYASINTGTKVIKNNSLK
ncbi:MAG: fibronectin type III domain-containing protein [Candidatus Kapabacteria bacterium]|nr:fibronectin type III domain-containing protein [Candidatus Kapabacteria bacterium]